MANILPIADDEDGLSVRNKLNEAITEANDVDNKVTGPASATDTRIAVFDGVTGKLIKQVPVTIDTLGSLNGVSALVMTGTLQISNGVPLMRLIDTNAAADNQRIAVSLIDGQLNFQYLNDANSGGGDFARFLRTGNNMTAFVLYDDATPTITLNNNGSATFGGAVTVADLIPTLLNGVAIANYVRIGGDISGTGAAPVINDEAITNAKLAHIATNRIKGRSTAGTGDVEDLTAAEVKTMLDLPTNTVTELADKLPLAGGTMTGAINGDQDIRGRRPQGETLTTGTPTYAGEYINQFYQVDGEVDFTLPTAPSGVSAGDVTEFLLIAKSGRIRFAIEGVTLYVTNLGGFTSGEFECTGAGDAVVLRYLGSDTYQLTGNNISQV